MEQKNLHMAYSECEKVELSDVEKTRIYNREYQKKYRKRKVRKEIMLSEKEYATIARSAEKHHKTIAEHLRTCVLAYLEKTIIVMSETELQNIRHEIRRIGVNINQIAYKVNRDGKEAFDELNFLSSINELERMIDVVATCPISDETLSNLAKASRLTLEDVKAILACSSKT